MKNNFINSKGQTFTNTHKQDMQKILRGIGQDTAIANRTGVPSQFAAQFHVIDQQNAFYASLEVKQMKEQVQKAQSIYQKLLVPIRDNHISEMNKIALDCLKPFIEDSDLIKKNISILNTGGNISNLFKNGSKLNHFIQAQPALLQKYLKAWNDIGQPFSQIYDRLIKATLQDNLHTITQDFLQNLDLSEYFDYPDGTNGKQSTSQIECKESLIDIIDEIKGTLTDLQEARQEQMEVAHNIPPINNQQELEATNNSQPNIGAMNEAEQNEEVLTPKTKKIKELEEKFAQLRTSLLQKDDDLKDKTDRIEELEVEARDNLGIQNLLSALNEQYEGTKDERDTYKGELDNLKIENANHANTIQERNDRIKELEDQIVEDQTLENALQLIKNDNSTIKQESADKDDTIGNQADTIKEKDIKYGEIKRENDELLVKLDNTQEKLSVVKDDNISLKHDKDDLRQDKNDLKDQVKELKNEISDWRECVQEKDDEIIKLRDFEKLGFNRLDKLDGIMKGGLKNNDSEWSVISKSKTKSLGSSSSKGSYYKAKIKKLEEDNSVLKELATEKNPQLDLNDLLAEHIDTHQNEINLSGNSTNHVLIEEQF